MCVPPPQTVSSLRLEAKQSRLELDLLRSLVSVLREDLNVKDEQFDFLYASLKVSGRERKSQHATTT